MGHATPNPERPPARWRDPFVLLKEERDGREEGDHLGKAINHLAGEHVFLLLIIFADLAIRRNTLLNSACVGRGDPSSKSSPKGQECCPNGSSFLCLSLSLSLSLSLAEAFVL